MNEPVAEVWARLAQGSACSKFPSHKVFFFGWRERHFLLSLSLSLSLSLTLLLSHLVVQWCWVPLVPLLRQHLWWWWCTRCAREKGERKTLGFDLCVRACVLGVSVRVRAFEGGACDFIYLYARVYGVYKECVCDVCILCMRVCASLPRWWERVVGAIVQKDLRSWRPLMEERVSVRMYSVSVRMVREREYVWECEWEFEWEREREREFSIRAAFATVQKNRHRRWLAFSSFSPSSCSRCRRSTRRCSSPPRVSQMSDSITITVAQTID